MCFQVFRLFLLYIYSYRIEFYWFSLCFEYLLLVFRLFLLYIYSYRIEFSRPASRQPASRPVGQPARAPPSAPKSSLFLLHRCPAVLQWRPQVGKRKQGSPTKRWKDEIRDFMGEEWHAVAANRELWTSFQAAFGKA